MDLNSLPLFSMISQRLGWLTERQKVLAENVANIDTPGYRARDLKPVDFGKLAAQAIDRLQPAATNPRHMAASGTGATARTEFTPPIAGEATLSGNTVSIESEMMKVAETAMDHQLITNLYRKHVGMLRAVLGRSQG
jgi:flagellar basal-body rod protein FlgB